MSDKTQPQKNTIFNPDAPHLVPTRTLAKCIGLSSERVRQLSEEGIFEAVGNKNRKSFDLIPSIQTYIEYLKKQSESSGGAESDEARKIKADADWKEAKAAIEQLRLEEFESIMHRSEDVESVINDLVMTVRGALIAFPGALAVDCAAAETPGEATAILKTAINELLNSLVDYEYDPKQFKKLVKQREDWINAEFEEEEEDES